MIRKSLKRTIGRKSLQILNRALASFDKFFIAENEGYPPPLFIVGLPRSGTTLAYQTIAYQFQVAYFTSIMDYFYGIPNLQFRLYKPFLKQPRPVFYSNYGRVKGLFAPAETGSIWSRWFPWDDSSSHYVRPDQYGEASDNYLDLKRNLNSVAAITKKPVSIKCVYLSMAINILAQLFSEARFIHVHRDMLMTIQSLFIGRQRQQDPTHWWSVKPPCFEQIQKQPLWQQAVEQAFFTKKIIIDQMSKVAPSRVFDVQYETLCQEPQKIMTQLETWLGEVGYQPYPTTDLPGSFPVSNKWVLDRDLLERMSIHLDRLSAMESMH